MSRLIDRAIERIFSAKRKTLTDAQEAGTACVLCGEEFLWPKPEYRKPWTCLGLPWRHRHYACANACTIETVPEVSALFRSMIPAGQEAWEYCLGVDDVPVITAPDDHDILDREYLDAIDAQPKTRVKIAHDDGILTTRPLPHEYAEKIAVQAIALGLTAMLDEGRAPRFTLEQDVATPDGPGIVIGVGGKAVKVTLEDGRTRDYPLTFVEPRSEFGR